MNDVKTLASSDIVIILVGNKSDMDDEREVTFMEATRFAQENNLIFLETSAKSGEGIEEVFMKCSRTILNKMPSEGGNNKKQEESNFFVENEKKGCSC